jgi:hypothetical protein
MSLELEIVCRVADGNEVPRHGYTEAEEQAVALRIYCLDQVPCFIRSVALVDLDKPAAATRSSSVGRPAPAH